MKCCSLNVDSETEARPVHFGHTQYIYQLYSQENSNLIYLGIVIITVFNFYVLLLNFLIFVYNLWML